MSNVIAVFLADMNRAAGAIRALDAQHAKGCLTIFGLALLERQADGTVHLCQPAVPRPFGGPLAELVRMLVTRAGSTAGDATDGLSDAGIDPGFVREALSAFAPGHFALLAEVEEHSLVAGDAALAEFGDGVIRCRLMHLAEDRIAREVCALDAELQALEREAEDAAGEVTAAIRRRAATDRRRLAALAERMDARLEALQAVSQARLALLDGQFRQAGLAEHARGDTRVRIALSIARMRAEAEQRIGQLRRAVEMARQALGTDAPEDG